MKQEQQEVSQEVSAESYEAQWGELAVRQRVAEVTVTSELFLGLLLVGLFPHPALAYFLAFIALCIGSSITTWNRVAGFRCPRCHQEFFDKGWRRDVGTKQCLHCGLPKGAEQGEGQEKGAS